MKRYLWTLPCVGVIAWSIWAWAAESKPEDIIKKMLQTYRSAKTYSENATETVKTKSGGRERTVTRTHRFSYEAPNKFYYDVKVQGSLMEAAASDGKTLFIYTRRRGRISELYLPPTMSEIKPTLESYDMMTQGDPLAFLCGEDLLPRGTKVSLVKSETLAGKAVYQMQLTQPDGNKPTLWIGKDDNLLYRVQLTITQNRGGVTETTQVTETHADVQLDKPLPADAFTIKLPAAPTGK